MLELRHLNKYLFKYKTKIIIGIIITIIARILTGDKSITPTSKQKKFADDILDKINKPKLRRFGDDEAWHHTQKTGNYIQFDDPKKAEWFSKNYKKVWDESKDDKLKRVANKLTGRGQNP